MPCEMRTVLFSNRTEAIYFYKGEKLMALAVHFNRLI